MKKLLATLKEKKLTLGSVESMTGGLFAAKFTDIPGASQVFKGTVVTYSSEVKTSIIGVKKSTIEKYGVVSKEVAAEMAEKGKKLLKVDICVSITGNAGPSVEPGGKPVGCFYVGIACKKGIFVKEFNLNGKRNKIRNKSILAMRDMIYLKSI